MPKVLSTEWSDIVTVIEVLGWNGLGMNVVRMDSAATV